MITKEIVVNDTTFKVILTDQVINQVDNLKSLYATVSESDPEDFEQISSQISSVINDIATAVEPEVSDSYLDGVIQEVFKAVEDKKSEVEKQIKQKDAKISKKKKK
jgi:hypothetical protein|tara:strand:- start:759 stop:1076 length:318 start_codon:yes stop_codon:yes gene_type:complete